MSSEDLAQRGRRKDRDLERRRSAMIDDIEAGMAATRSLTGRERLGRRVLRACRQVRREDFVPPDLRRAAFRDGALPLGYGQTISQPYIVALMTDLLDLDERSRVLEVGTGSGYQAAILSCLAQRVYTIERIAQLAESARKRLRELGYDNVETRCGDGYRGWPEQAPFDAIVVTAAAPVVPPMLLEQLKPGGRMVIPVGMPARHQELMLVTRDLAGEIHQRSVLAVAFVPMVEDA
ncbi:MAG TPA: protein-L-isoaspartate(D-aspartate) O-methyltransferase [Gammaproteobacteria bacterium]|jgi:protein-L-isoaspartate(D-aspartate) O-methyltransferase